MSQRASGYERKERDEYNTPEWVTRALLPHIPRNVERVLEPAAGKGQMVSVLREAGYRVTARDITAGKDFLDMRTYRALRFDALITNPPYKLATEFVEHALYERIRFIAMLMRTDWDHAAGRQHLISECPAFAKKVVLTRRIVWFEPAIAAPSFNHAWFIWRLRHKGPPTLSYYVERGGE